MTLLSQLNDSSTETTNHKCVSYRGGEDGGGVQLDRQYVPQLGNVNQVHSNGELLECQVTIPVRVRQLPVMRWSRIMTSWNRPYRIVCLGNMSCINQETLSKLQVCTWPLQGNFLFVYFITMVT